jgi:hypothetical protein
MSRIEEEADFRQPPGAELADQDPTEGDDEVVTDERIVLNHRGHPTLGLVHVGVRWCRPVTHGDRIAHDPVHCGRIILPCPPKQ